MKTLCLIRHADASWGEIDYERPLNEKGVENAKKIAEYLSKKTADPDIIVSSHTKRALRTAEILAKGFNYPHNEILIETKLYNEGVDKIGEVIYSLPEDKNFAMIIGHNPYITQFANEFLKNKIDYLPPAGIVSINFNTNQWNKISIVKKEVNFVMQKSNS